MLTLTSDEILALVTATHRAPRSVLGYHELAREDAEPLCLVRVFEPDATAVEVGWEDESIDKARPLKKLHPAGLFEGRLPHRRPLTPYRLRVHYAGGAEAIKHDPYYFSPQL